MRCQIYKGSKKQDHYIYLPEEGDRTKIPDSLLKLLGRLELVMTLELTPQTRLARANPDEILKSCREHGFYLQLPPQTERGGVPSRPIS